MVRCNKKKIIVVGAGISGLATAALLAKDGCQVTVLEKNSFLGGRASFFTKDGYFFDKGPSWYMMPEVFDSFFSIFGKKTSDYYKLQKLNVHYKVFFNSKKTFSITDDINLNASIFEKEENGASVKFKKYLAESEFIYNKSMKELVMLDYSFPLQILKPQLLYYLFRFKLFLNLHTYVSKYFSNKNLQKILEFTTVFLGGSPYNTPAFYCLVAHADFNLGIFYPMGGMHEIVKALVGLCKEHGVTILTNHEVTRIISNRGFVTHVAVGKKSFTADFVISSMDYRNFEVNLLSDQDQSYPQKYWSKKTLSPGAFIIYLGISKKLKNVEHHNLYFDNSWEDNFENVFKNKIWPDNPSYYVHMPSKTDPTVAPPGGESLMFLVPVAPGLADNEKIRRNFSQKIISHFEKITGEKISPYMKVKRIYAHDDFIKEYNAFSGSAFGLAHTLSQTAIFRPKNKSRKLQNLYYVGQYTNPGVGVPICLLSAQIVRNMVNRAYEGIRF